MDIDMNIFIRAVMQVNFKHACLGAIFSLRSLAAFFVRSDNLASISCILSYGSYTSAQAL